MEADIFFPFGLSFYKISVINSLQVIKLSLIAFKLLFV